MAPSDELEYLKHLVAQLNEKIHALEAKAKSVVPPKKTPAQQLRTILMGPPGAGSCCLLFVYSEKCLSCIG
jgi:adenylate kinase